MSDPTTERNGKSSGIAKVFDSRERDRGVPAPWAYRWTWRIFVTGIMIYSYYVMVGRLCAPMLQRKETARGSVGQGAGFLVGETILFVMFFWAYVKAMITSPGIAPREVPRSDPPVANGIGQDGESVAPGPLQGGRNLLPAEIPVPEGWMSGSGIAGGVGLDDMESRHRASESRIGLIGVNDKKKSRHAQVPTRPLSTDPVAPSYCQYCQIYKPPRCHHCRVCGICVLGMDHDCPWVGCIGWRNHKFFMNFLLWSTLYTVYVLVVLVCKLASTSGVDGQMIGVAAAAGFFAMFSASMFASHAHLICIGMTTIESFSLRSQLDRERAFLSQQFGFCGWTGKRRTMNEWRREWGDLKTDGNRWYLGPRAMDEWKRVMGGRWIEWILPIGRSAGDGLYFEQNPRFASDGSRKRRHEWASELHA